MTATGHRRALAFALCALIAQPLPATADSSLETAGTVLQIVLPAAAAVCAINQHRGAEFFAGLAAQAIVVHGLKTALGDSKINRRPDGGTHGFPSGHVAAATYGAVSLARKCFPDRPVLKVISYGLALAVAISRYNANRHTAAQIGAGALTGYFANGITVSADHGRLGLGYSLKF